MRRKKAGMSGTPKRYKFAESVKAAGVMKENAVGQAKPARPYTGKRDPSAAFMAKELIDKDLFEAFVLWYT